jgi:hypothetical protein
MLVQQKMENVDLEKKIHQIKKDFKTNFKDKLEAIKTMVEDEGYLLGFKTNGFEGIGIYLMIQGDGCPFRLEQDIWDKLGIRDYMFDGQKVPIHIEYSGIIKALDAGDSWSSW